MYRERLVGIQHKHTLTRTGAGHRTTKQTTTKTTRKCNEHRFHNCLYACIYLYSFLWFFIHITYALVFLFLFLFHFTLLLFVGFYSFCLCIICCLKFYHYTKSFVFLLFLCVCNWCERRKSPKTSKKSIFRFSSAKRIS